MSVCRTPRLCQPCMDLQLGQHCLDTCDANEWNSIDTQSHPGLASKSALESSSKRCDSCCFIYDSLFASETEDHHQPIDLVVSITDPPPPWLLNVFAVGRHISIALEALDQPCHLRNRKTFQFPTALQIPSDPLSTRSLSTIRHWMRSCEDHVECKAHKPAMLPARLLDIGTIDDPHLRLIENNNGETGRYLALSHCWGKYQHFDTLREDNIASFKDAIDEPAMPKTFRDAVILARRLGISFVWIDSLTIIQDSLQDWSVQSSKMRDVYHNAYLTVSAANSPSDEFGFLHVRPPAAVKCGEVTMNGITRDLILTDRIGESDPLSNSALRNEPLTQRGWAFQERLLSRRILSFGKRQMFWECLKSISREDGFCFDPIIMGQQSKSIHDSARKHDPSHLRKGWQESVQIYSRCDLTQPSDRLPAISGLAAQYADALQDEYLAGHWLRDLPFSLRWKIEWDEEQLDLTKQPHMNRRCPSWSWGSVDHEVEFETLNDSMVASVQDHEVKLKGPNPFGEVIAAKLKLRAPTVRLQLPERIKSMELTGGHIGHIDSRLEDGSLILEHRVENRQRGCEPNLWLDERLNADEELWALIVTTEYVREGWVGGLILARGGGAGTMRRVGVFDWLDLPREDFDRIPIEDVILE